MLRFVHISDTHFTEDPSFSPEQARYAPAKGALAIIEQVNSLPFTPDFILHTGDIALDPIDELYPRIKEVFAAFKAPVVYLPGNHDDIALTQTLLMGKTPADDLYYHTFERNGVQIICLDSNGPGVEVPRGYIPPAELDWLAGVIANSGDRPLVIAVHHHILPTGDSAWYDEFMRTTNGAALHEVLKPVAARVRGVFHGHVHQHIEFLQDGVLYSCVPSTWRQFHTWPGQPDTIEALDGDPGYAIVTVNETRTQIQRYRFRVD